MAEFLMMRSGAGLFPLNKSDREQMEKLPHGKDLRVNVTAMRNSKFHRKAFSLLNLGFDCWSPDCMVTKVETDTVVKLSKFMVSHGLPEDSAHAMCTAFLSELNTKRGSIDAYRSFESFRDWVTVEAGFYRIVQTPAGVKKEPLSISFSSMDETKFGEYYKAIFDVIWQLILFKTFPSEKAAQEAVDNMLGFS